MTEWTMGRAVDVCLRAYSEHLLTLIGHCPPMVEMTGRDGTVVNLSSVSDVMHASFDETVREAAAEVVRPLQVHKQVGARLVGTRDSGFLGVLLAPFTFRPGLGTVITYLSAELKRRAAQFREKGDAVEVDLHAPLELQARRAGRKMGYLVLEQVTQRYRRIAAHPVVSWK